MFKKIILSCLILTSCCLTIRTAQAWEFRAGTRALYVIGEDVDEVSRFAISFADLAAYYNVTSDISLGLSYSFNKYLFVSLDEDDVKFTDKKFNWHEIGLDFIWDLLKISKFSVSARTTVNLVNIVNFQFKRIDHGVSFDTDYDLKGQLPFNFRFGTGVNYNITDNLKLYSEFLLQYAKLKIDKINISLNVDEYIKLVHPNFDELTEVEKEELRAMANDNIKQLREYSGEGEKMKIYGLAMTLGVRYLL